MVHILFLILMLSTILSSDSVLKSFAPTPTNHVNTGFPFSYEPVGIGFMNIKGVRDFPARKESLWLLN